ncbi:hypothetical protein BDN72DRAFT_79784 [Pluteus cervinus]|uniref:Uncharacterized protein n=1 Tax=Pluteus cervinus TaxID=181527 RepID=A0ACD3B9P5_9AGAR|nr:hypothetical protein BDN72DRAFT_79784 [Pluteus cervinus]
MDNSPLRHIPTELILEITGSLTPDHFSVLNLAQTCQHLNRLIMPSFLPLFGLETASDTLEINLPSFEVVNHFDILSVLLAARAHIPSVKRFSCHLPGKSDHVITHFHRLTPFISRLSSLGSVEIVFSQKEDWNIASGDIKDLRRWIHAFEALFNAFIERGCSELTVRRGSIFDLAFYVRNSIDTVAAVDWVEADGPSSRLLNNKKIATTLKGRHWSWLRHPDFTGKLPKFSRAAQQNCSNLKTLRIASNFFLVPPCSEWVFALVKHASNLTTLEIVDILRPYEKWLPIIPILVSCLSRHKCLESLVIHRTTIIPVPALLYLLSSLPFLRRLSLDASVHYVSPLATDVPSNPPKFPNLEYVEVPSDYLAFFLTKDNRLPALKEVWIHPRTRYFPELDCDSSIHLSPLLNAVANQCSVVGLVGLFHMSEPPPTYIPSSGSSSSKSGLSRRISGFFKSLQEDTLAKSVFLGLSPASHPRSCGSLSCFDLVTALVLSSSYGSFDVNSPRFHEWMTLFPNVTRLQLQAGISSDALSRLKETLRKSNPNLTTISVGPAPLWVSMA